MGYRTSIKSDYLYSSPVFLYKIKLYGEAVDIFTEAWSLDEAGNRRHLVGNLFNTISEYYEAIDELEEERLNKRSWAV